MTDLSELAGGPPSGDNVELNTLRGRVSSPPLSATDAMEVVVPSFSGALSYTVPASNWAPSFAALPQQDAPCLVVIDSDGDAWVPVWQGMSSAPVLPRFTALESRATSLEGRATALEASRYAEVNGGADVALPNTAVWVDVLNATGSPITFQIVTGAAPEVWQFNGNMLVRADSANDTPIIGAIYCVETGLVNPETATHLSRAALAYTQRNYWSGTGNNLQAYSTLTMRRRITLPASVTTNWRMAARIALGPFGGDYHRGFGCYTNFGAERKP